MFLKAVAAILGFCLLTMIGVAFAVYHAGVLVVDVQDKREGSHIFIPVPMLMADFGLLFLPKENRMQIHEELAGHGEMARALARELADCPDGVFLEVEDGNEKVVIEKSGDNFIVDVNSKDESVYLKIPISSSGRILNKLAEMQ